MKMQRRSNFDVGGARYFQVDTTPSSGDIALFLTRDECDTLLESLKIRLQQLLLTFSMKFKFFT